MKIDDDFLSLMIEKLDCVNNEVPLVRNLLDKAIKVLCEVYYCVDDYNFPVDTKEEIEELIKEYSMEFNDNDINNKSYGIEYQYLLNLINGEDISFSDAINVLTNYLRLHKNRADLHWLWIAIERVVYGENERDVMEDYGYVYYDGDEK